MKNNTPKTLQDVLDEFEGVLAMVTRDIVVSEEEEKRKLIADMKATISHSITQLLSGLRDEINEIELHSGFSSHHHDGFNACIGKVNECFDKVLEKGDKE